MVAGFPDRDLLRVIKANAAAREALMGAVEHVREQVINWPGLRGYKTAGLDPASLPVEIGLSGSAPLVFCRQCGMVLPYAWDSPGACACRKPEPALLVPHTLFPESVRLKAAAQSSGT